MATAFSLLGAMLFAPVSWVEENMIGGNGQRSLKDVVMGWRGVEGVRMEKTGEVVVETGNGVVLERLVVVETVDGGM